MPHDQAMTSMGAGKIAVSVIVPTFNASGKVHVALQSLLAQDFRDFEVIIVDDCSADFEQLSELVRSPPYDQLRIRLVRSDRKIHSSGARNLGFDLAAGEYVALLDADDGWRADKLQVCVQRLEQLKAEAGTSWIVHSRSSICKGRQAIKIMPKGPIDDGESVAEYLFGPRGWIQTSTMVLRADDARRIRFDPKLKRHSDYDFCIRAARMGLKFDLIWQPLVQYHVDPDTSLRGKGETIDYVRGWLEQMAPYLNRRDLFTYRAYQLPRRVRLERGPLAAALVFLANFPFTSRRNQKAFLQLVWGKLFGTRELDDEDRLPMRSLPGSGGR